MMMLKLGIDKYSTVFSTAFVTTLMIILVLSRPSKEKKEDEQNISQSLLYSRIGLIALSTGLIIYAYTATTNPISYTNIGTENAASEINLVDTEEDYTISQPVEFEDERELKELILKFHNELYTRANFTIVNVEIWNLTNNTCIFDTKIGSSEIKTNELVYIPINNAKVNNNDKYEIRLTATKGTRFYQGIDYISAYFTKDIDEKVGAVKVNGESKPNTLYFQIR